MSDDFRKQIYNNLNLKETDELIEIWKKNDRVEWSELAFDVLRGILQQRLGELPSQDEPVFEHGGAQGEISFYDDSFDENLEQNGAIIKFKGFYSKETLRKKTATRGKLTQQQITWRVIIFIVLVVLFLLSCSYILQSKEYFSRATLYPFIILGILYSLYIHPYLEPYFQTKSAWSDSKFYEGVISSQGIRFITPEKSIKAS